MYRYGSAGITTAVTVALPVLVWMSIYMAAGTAGDHPSTRREAAILVASATDTTPAPPSRHIAGWLMDYAPQHNTPRAEKGRSCSEEEETPAEHIYVVYVPARPGASSSAPGKAGECDPTKTALLVVVTWLIGMAILVGMGADC